MIKITWLLLIVFICCQGCGQSQSIGKTTSINQADLAYSRYDYPKSLAAYKAFWDRADSGKIEERVLAAQRLAYFEWHVERDIKKARLWTEKALSLEFNKSGSLKALSLFELEAKNFQKSLDLAREAEVEAKTTFEKRLAMEQLCTTIFSQALHQLEAEKKIETSSLKEALKKINDLAGKYPEDLDLAKLRIGIAVLNRDFSNTFHAWKNYFRIDDVDPPKGLIGKSFEFLQKVEATKLGFSEMDNELLKGIAIAFIDSRLFDYSTLIIKLFENQLRFQSDTLSNLFAYDTYLKDAEILTYQFYRDLAGGKGNQQKFKDQLILLEKEFWKNTNWVGKNKDFSHSNFLTATKKIFGSRQTRGIVNGYYAFYCWHEITNELESIDQYGRKATLNVISMDYLVSKDYSGWFQSEQRVGGTATSNTIITLRAAMLQEPVAMWNQFNDPIKRKEMEDQIVRLQKFDIELARKDPHALLPGMRLNILFESLENIYDSLKISGLGDSGLKLGFINYFSNYFYSSTLIHEARHSIDKRIGGFNSDQMEYRAKLSEVALSQAPLLTFAAQVLREESPNASHGVANGRLVKDMVKWMERNSDEIKDFQEKVPMILQLDKLTNEQVILAMKSLDPLAVDR